MQARNESIQVLGVSLLKMCEKEKVAAVDEEDVSIFVGLREKTFSSSI